MTGTAAPTARQHAARLRGIEFVGFALLAYVPFLLSSPGKIAADTKQYLYLDPGRLLSRALSLWDPHVAAGTVPHQQVGYLFPMGPYYWLMQEIGVPDWVAQRLWMGTISLLAALGARWLFAMLGARRVGALAGALVYMLTPYQLAFTARISVLLLAWAALPWLIGLTMRAVRDGGWRDPALIALVILTTGSVNASSMLFMLVGPGLWVVVELASRRVTLRVVAGALVRIGLLTLGVSLWWIIGLRIQGKYGLPVLQLTENLRVASLSSSPDDLLRGLGNWFFYGTDYLGYSIAQAGDYVTNHAVTVFSYGVPVLALGAAAVLRWRHRTYLVALVAVGVVIGVGSWPYDHPSLYGRVWRWFADGSSIGLALRNTPRVVPIIVLGLAGLLAGAVSSLAGRRREVIAAAVVAVVAFGALLPVWRGGYLSDGVERPEDVPSYWQEAIAALDREGDATRILEIPGANFSAYRWGNTVEPITTGLTDRPVIAREVLPYGSAQTVNLLDALDRRMQEGTFEAQSLAPVARLLASGTVLLRSDLEYERFGLVRPRDLWDLLTVPGVAPGLGAPTAFGPTTPNLPASPLVDAITLRDTTKGDPPAVATFPVEDALPIVHTAPSDRPVLLAGDGDGIVDAAAAGLVDGNQLILQSASMTDAELASALRNDADLVVTDSNRRRAQSWFSSLRDTKGATERAGETLPDPNGVDFRLDVFPGAGDDTRTVVEQRGGKVDATADGGVNRPEDRAARAFDHDLRTSWRVGGADPTGHDLVLVTTSPTRADHVTLVQPQDGPRDRVLTRASVQVNDRAPITVDLGPESLTPEGQVVEFPETDVHRLVVHTLATSTAPFDPELANAVGFAEVRLDDVKVTETVRLPVDLTDRVDGRAADHALDLVLSRLRYEPADRAHQDQELSLRRRFVLPDARTFGLSGTARVNPNAADPVIDSVLGTTAPGASFVASSHLLGDADARASRAFDGDDATAWTAAVGPQNGQSVGVDLGAPTTVDGINLGIVADGRHSVPEQLHLEADGVAQTIELPEITDGAEPGHVVQVPVSFPPVTASKLRVVVDRYRPVDPDGSDAIRPDTLPVSLATIGITGVATPADPRAIAGECRDDLLRIDGARVAVRLTGDVADARRGFGLEACDGPIALDAGSHTVTSSVGLDSGVDVDRVTLSSSAAGTADPVAARGAPLDTSGAEVKVLDAGSTSMRLQVRTDGTPFWLVLAQSYNEGWEASPSRGAVGTHQVVDGYANGWLVRPGGSGTMTVELRWTPQRLVWIGFAVSAVAIVVCLAILVVAFRRRRRVDPVVAADVDTLAVGDAPRFAWPVAYDGPDPALLRTAFTAVALGLATAAFSRWWIGAVAAVAVLLAKYVPRARIVIAFAVPVVLGISRMTHTPELGWLSVALVLADLAGMWLHHRSQE